MIFAAWYDAHPVVRRLWAVQEPQALRVILSLEPTMDNGDIAPVWLAHSSAWEREMRCFTGAAVRLEFVDEPLMNEIEIDASGEIIAAFSWRDPTLLWSIID